LARNGFLRLPSETFSGQSRSYGHCAKAGQSEARRIYPGIQDIFRLLFQSNIKVQPAR
jgi:hypothetical protein